MHDDVVMRLRETEKKIKKRHFLIFFDRFFCCDFYTSLRASENLTSNCVNILIVEKEGFEDISLE